MGFWAALQFLTIFPTPLHRQASIEETGRSLSYFPAVGLILGLILLGADYLFSLVLPTSVVSALLIAVLVVLSGAHHLDGFIDTCDGVIAGKSKGERLAIMADSKVGAFGISGALLLLLVKYAALWAILQQLRLPALLLMPTLSRCLMVWAVFAFPYARTSGTGLAFKRGANWSKLAIATVITLAVSLILLGWWGAVLMAALWLLAFGIASYLNSRLGGLTGDSYGAINEVTEVMTLLLLIPLAGWL